MRIKIVGVTDCTLDGRRPKYDRMTDCTYIRVIGNNGLGLAIQTDAVHRLESMNWAWGSESSIVKP